MYRCCGNISNLVYSPTWWVGPSAGSPLGAMPLPAALAGLSTSLAASTAAPTLASLLPCPKPPAEGAVVLSSALPPLELNWPKKIKSQQYVAMKELMADNMALHSQLEDLPAQAAVGACLHRLREIDSPLSWVFCFLGYVAVRTKDSETRNMLSYARLIVREAQCHGGIGWLEYDKWFRQQPAALTTQHPWNELNASLHAATVMSLRSEDSKLCKLCDSQCALASLQSPQPYAWPMSAGAAAGRRVTRPDTLERICTSRAAAHSQAPAGLGTCVPLANAKVTGPESVRRLLQAPHTRQVLNQQRRAQRALSSKLAGSRQCRPQHRIGGSC